MNLGTPERLIVQAGPRPLVVALVPLGAPVARARQGGGGIAPGWSAGATSAARAQRLAQAETAATIPGSAQAAAKASSRRRMSRPSSHTPMRSATGASHAGRIVKL